MRCVLLPLILSFFLAGAATAVTGASSVEIDAGDLATEFNKLTAAQKAQVAADIAIKAEAGAKKMTDLATDIQVEDVEPWLELIDHLGQGLVKLAHDLGVETNTLLNSPVGVITMGLVVYHVMGPEIVDIVLGVFWFFFSFPLLGVFFFKGVIPIQEFADAKKITIFGREKTVSRTIRREMDFNAFGPDWILVILLILNTLVTLAIMA